MPTCAKCNNEVNKVYDCEHTDFEEYCVECIPNFTTIWQKVRTMLTEREIAIYALGKTEGVHSIAETLGKGLDDEKYIESWNKTMKLLGIELSLKELEKIYKEFAEKMEQVVDKSESENKDSMGKKTQKTK